MKAKNILLYIVMGLFAIPIAISLIISITLSISSNPLLVSYMPSFLLGLGGIFSVFVGWRLYLHGVGIKASEVGISFENISVSLKNVGSVVMATSALWAYIGYLSLPNESVVGSLSQLVAQSFEMNPPEGPGTTISQRGTASYAKNKDDSFFSGILGFSSKDTTSFNFGGGQTITIRPDNWKPPVIETDENSTLKVAYDKEDSSVINVIYNGVLVNSWEKHHGVTYLALDELLKRSIPKLDNESSQPSENN